MDYGGSFALSDASDLKTCPLRDQKPIAARLRRAFGGTGHRVKGGELDTVPAFRQLLLRKLGAE